MSTIILFQPSSSGRSAELLGGSTGKLFSTLKDNNNYIATSNNTEVDSNVSQDFLLVIKKMNKKDPITRHKVNFSSLQVFVHTESFYSLLFLYVQALLEFADLCNTSDVDSVKAVLPFWPRLYNTYAIDIDFRVREATQQAHRAIVMAVKRDIAPYLKQIMGTWFVSPFDSHTLAANIAKTSFQVSSFTFFYKLYSYLFINCFNVYIINFRLLFLLLNGRKLLYSLNMKYCIISLITFLTKRQNHWLLQSNFYHWVEKVSRSVVN